MRAAVLQLSAQGMSSTKLYNYIRIASKQNVKVLLLGEYILNPFFKELQGLSPSMIDEQAKHQAKVLKEMAHTYDITIVAPLVVVKKGGFTKPWRSLHPLPPLTTSSKSLSTIRIGTRRSFLPTHQNRFNLR